MTYTEKTESLIQKCKEQGFNLWPMLAIFKRRSKLAPEIPDEVIQGVCMEYLTRMKKIRADFPYFLQVLERKSRDYFANREIEEHMRLRNEPCKLKITLG